MIKRLNIILIAIILSSCLKQSENMVVNYFNLDSMLVAQKDYLLQNKMRLDKWAFVDTDTAQNTYTPDSLGWKDELAFFNKMNINKPVLQGVYKESVENDINSNLKVKSFIPQQGADVEVQYLKLYYLKELNDLKKIEALYLENNPIYKSQRKFTLLFEEKSGQAVIDRFFVEGSQKMILKDSVKFKIEGNIINP